MKKPSNAILWIGFALCLTVIGAIDLPAQTPLSDEKKRNLRKFDPGDIFPDAREADQNKKDSSDSKSKSKRGDRKRDSESDQSESVEDTKPTPTPSPRTIASPATPANTGLQPSPTASPASLQTAASTDQNQEPPAPGSSTASSGLLSLPILFVLVLATLGGLIATIFKLLKLSAQLGFRKLGSE